MKINQLIFFAFIISFSVLSTACTKYYGPALHGYEVAYIPKATFKDSVINTQMGVSGFVQSGGGYNSEDEVNAMKGLIHAAHAFRFYDVNYAAFAYSGSYLVRDSILNDNGTTDGSERFNGYGLQFGINLVYRGKNFTFRYLGADLVFYNESGEYLDFRKRIEALGPNDMYQTLGGRKGVSLVFGTELETYVAPLQGYLGGKASFGKSMNFSYQDDFEQNRPSYLLNLHGFYKREHFYVVGSIQGSQQGVASLGFGYIF